MSKHKYEPSVADLIEAYAMSEDGLDFKRAAQERREAAREALAAHDAEVRQEQADHDAVRICDLDTRLVAAERELAEVRAGVVAEEPEGRRWYAACWRDDNGVLNSLESWTVLREYAEADVKRWRAAESKEQGGQPDRVVLATKIEHPWVPVEQGDET